MPGELKERIDYTLPQAAKVLGYKSTGQLLNRIKRGEIKAYRLFGNGNWRIPWAEIERIRGNAFSPNTSKAL